MNTIMEYYRQLSEISFLGNTLMSYSVSALTFILVFVALGIFKFVLAHYLKKIAARTTSDLDDFIINLISNIGVPVFLAISFYVAISGLNMGESLRNLFNQGVLIVLAIRGIYLIHEIVQFAIVKIYRKHNPLDTPSAQATVKTLSSITKWTIWLLGAVFILDNLGVNISSLVAGIGIGGVAVAIASQAVLGDAFSALSIYLDKPFEVGDFIIIDEHLGSVEHIGIKTTRIRSLSGEQLVFSNSDLTKSRIKNYKRMSTRRIVFTFGVTYQTAIEKLEEIPSIVKKIIESDKKLRLDRVHFQSFKDSSLNFEAAYFVLTDDYNVYMDKQQAINLAIMKAFRKEGIDFAYPTQTVFLKNV